MHRLTVASRSGDERGGDVPAAPARPRRWTRLVAWAADGEEERRATVAAWRAALATKEEAMARNSSMVDWDRNQINANDERERENSEGLKRMRRPNKKENQTASSRLETLRDPLRVMWNYTMYPIWQFIYSSLWVHCKRAEPSFILFKLDLGCKRVEPLLSEPN